MSIIDQTVQAVPDVSWRLRDFLASRVSRPIPEPPQDVPAAEAEAPDASEAPEGESGTEEEAEPAGELEPYALNSIAVPPKDEPAAVDAEPGQ